MATAAVTAANNGGIVAAGDRFEALSGVQAELIDARTALNRTGANVN